MNAHIFPSLLAQCERHLARIDDSASSDLKKLYAHLYTEHMRKAIGHLELAREICRESMGAQASEDDSDDEGSVTMPCSPGCRYAEEVEESWEDDVVMPTTIQ